MGTDETLTVISQDYNEALEKSNLLLRPPVDLSEEEIAVWKEITELIISSTRYKKPLPI